MGVLPSLPGGDTAATFSTTPLYHGGIADCFRAWTSESMIWLFPEKKMSITARNVSSCLAYADEVNSRDSVPPVKYFSSVPYVLQMLAEDVVGLDHLKQMDIVGVGGAALPPSVGNRLVENHVNLISRFGSAECGFLMSSHRDYEKDKAWDFLRPGSGLRFLSFEPRDGDLSELVIKPGWPHMAKTNRDDGSFATSDLFETHLNIPEAWRYNSRSDAQITLITGKKFDPAPIESDILSSSPLLEDVLVFGTGESYPGLLLFPANDVEILPEELIEEVWPAVDELNQKTQSHARIPKLMVSVVFTKRGDAALEKSSKGTIMRASAERRYFEQIKSAYSAKALASNGYHEPIPDSDVKEEVLNILNQVIGHEVDPAQDLFGQGIDSSACVQIRGLLEKRFGSPSQAQLPLNVVYDSGTALALSDFILDLRHGRQAERFDEHMVMNKLVEDYSNVNPPTRLPRAESGEVVVLTGATGALGAHILHLLRDNKGINKIYCLLRGQTPSASHERVNKSLQARKLPPLKSFEETTWRQERVVCLPCKLSSPNLNLSSEDYEGLANKVTLTIHSAWAVNFSLRLTSFVKDHISGIRNLLNLTTRLPTTSEDTPPRFLFISSTASVISSPTTPIPETLSTDPADSSSLGYSRSKWVAENICANAAKKLEQTISARDIPSSRPSITILRLGQLCGDTKHGIWNLSEAYPLILSSAKVTEGALPDLGKAEFLNWLPVDLAAKGVLEIAFGTTAAPADRAREDRDDLVEIYNVLNTHEQPTWSDLLTWIREDSSGSDGRGSATSQSNIHILPPAQWLSTLEEALQSPPPSSSPHSQNEQLLSSLSSLVPLWKSIYTPPPSSPPPMPTSTSTPTPIHTTEAKRDQPTFSTFLSCKKSETLRDLEPIGREDVMRIWAWICNREGQK